MQRLQKQLRLLGASESDNRTMTQRSYDMLLQRISYSQYDPSFQMLDTPSGRLIKGHIQLDELNSGDLTFEGDDPIVNL